MSDKPASETAVPNETAAPLKRPLEVAAKDLKIEPHWLAGVMAGKKWDALYLVTDAELLAAVDEAKSIRLS